jgi:ketosteroid isomerase-like protein
MGESEVRERVLRYFELVDSGRLEELLKLFYPEVVYERGGTGTIQGLDQLRRFYLEQRVIEHGKHKLETVLVDGSWAAVRGSFTGVLKSGERVSIRFSDFHQFREGKIWRRYSYFMDRAV